MSVFVLLFSFLESVSFAVSRCRIAAAKTHYASSTLFKTAFILTISFTSVNRIWRPTTVFSPVLTRIPLWSLRLRLTRGRSFTMGPIARSATAREATAKVCWPRISAWIFTIGQTRPCRSGFPMETCSTFSIMAKVWCLGTRRKKLRSKCGRSSPSFVP